MKKQSLPIEELIRRIDFPHLRDGGKWLKTGAASPLKRLCFYGRKLRELGMSDIDIQTMFSDLYWDAVSESELNQKAKSTPPTKGPAPSRRA